MYIMWVRFGGGGRVCLITLSPLTMASIKRGILNGTHDCIPALRDTPPRHPYGQSLLQTIIPQQGINVNVESVTFRIRLV